MSIKPRLWRDHSYSAPGLPRPTMMRMSLPINSLPIADCRLPICKLPIWIPFRLRELRVPLPEGMSWQMNLGSAQIGNRKSAIGNDPIGNARFLLSFFLLRLPFFLFRLRRFFVFLLALANQLGLGGCFLFGDRRLNYFFLHEADRSNNGFRRRQYFDLFVGGDVRYVQHIVNSQVRDIDIDRLRYVARVAANLYFAENLFEDTLLLADADRLAHQVQGNGDFDLLSADQPSEISVDQSTTNRVDLAIVKHDFARAN